jgi:hypothetical protein
MHGYRLAAAIGFALLLAGCTQQPAGTAAPPAAPAAAAAAPQAIPAAAAAPQAIPGLPANVPAIPPGMARIWMLYQVNVEQPIGSAATPVVNVDGMGLGPIAQGTYWYHDLPPGAHLFSVTPYGIPTHRRKDTVALAAGQTAFLQVQDVPNWELGSTISGNEFAVLTMVPQDAEATLPTLRFLGPR